MKSSRNGNEADPATRIFESLTAYNGFVDFILKNPDRVFRYWVYKKVFTPYELEHKFIDESRYEDSYASFGVVREVIPLPENDYLLGIAQVFETLADLREDHAHIDYYRLSEIRLAYYPNEQEDFRNDED